MELGEKLKQARQEAGLSQRALCGDAITRNMLSQIEHGTARPSMDTLRYLAARLEKPLSYFLEEEAACSPNQRIMTEARAAFDRGDAASVLALLRDFVQPDGIYDREREVLICHSLLNAAEIALREGRKLYALELLDKAGESRSPYLPESERKRLLLLAQAGGDPAEICKLLPNVDAELLLRARGALASGDPKRAGCLLDAAENQAQPDWNLLRGEVWLAQKHYTEAAQCFHRAEDENPAAVAPRLEACYRELGNYQQAYFYACKQK